MTPQQRESDEVLRQTILDLSPEIRRDVANLTDILRHLVNTERAKHGLDDPRGALELWPNREKKKDSDPLLIGKGRVNGRSYQVRAWLNGQNLRIGLSPAKRDE